jgi:hydrogenase maturation protease
MKERILIAGIGNIFFGDDAFGPEVVRALLSRKLAAEARVEDFGIRGYDLAFALTSGFDAVILVDAMPGGEAPGTISLVEPELFELDSLSAGEPDAHSMNPVSALRLARAMGEVCDAIYLVACNPSILGGEDGEMGLSAPVRAAIPRAVQLIESLVVELLAGERIPERTLMEG